MNLRCGAPVVVAMALMMGTGAASAQTTAMPGVGPKDGRAAIDVTQPPWSSVVRVNTEAGTHCTGAVIGPRAVVTAAHCLVAPRTGKAVRAERVHVLAGYARGEFKAHARAAAIILAPGFMPERRGPPGADWAILELDRSLPATPLAFARDVAPGTPAMLAGWQRDRAHVLLGDTSCRIEAVVRDASGPLIQHDCAHTRGASGGPVLVRIGEAWAIAGVAALARDGARGGFAVPASAVAPHAAPRLTRSPRRRGDASCRARNRVRPAFRPRTCRRRTACRCAAPGSATRR